MIRTVKIDIHAENPSFPLQPVEVFEHSAASFTILNVPRAHGKREIGGVTVIVTDVDGVARGVAAVRNGSAWNVTIPESSIGRSGTVANGVMIAANGLDERGAVVPMWILGVGDLTVMRADGSVAPGEVRDTVHFFETAPSNPSRGDIAPIEGVLKLFNGEEWMDIGGGSSGGSIVLTLDSTGKKIFNGSVEITTFNDLLALVRAGGVALMGSVGAQKDALFYPLYCEETAIRFDATGTLGNDIKTKSYTMQPISGDAIKITEGSTVDLAKKADLTALANKVGEKIDALATGSEAQFSNVVIAKNFHESAVDNQAIITGFSVPSRFVNSGMFNSIKIRGANSDSGVWDRVSKLRNLGEGHIPSVDSSSQTMPINAFATYSFSDVWSFRSRDFEFLKDNGDPASVRVALVSVDPSEGYSVRLSNGSTLTNFAPVFEFIGVENRRDFLDRSITRHSNLSAVKALASNASQSQIIAKINELINLL